MNLYDNLPKKTTHIPNEINLKGDTALNEETTALIREALAKGANSDTQIFSQFEKLLAKHKAAMIANHENKRQNAPSYKS